MRYFIFVKDESIHNLVLQFMWTEELDETEFTNILNDIQRFTFLSIV